MATSITTNLNDEDEATLNSLTAEYNGDFPAPNPQLTPAQFFREHARDWLRSHRRRFLDRDNTGLIHIKDNLMTPEDRATVDLLFNKYR